tara:strand:+ start:1781 stop:2788 length:1008 start_codon:yes stop_codon:yes gene_type:complete
VSNKLFSNALNNIAQVTPPIWFMRQAGRYHKHYREFKKKYTFEELCKDPELSSEIACGPIKDFDFDIGILFSDILFVLEGLGLSLKFDPGPIFSEELTSKNVDKYRNIDKAIEHLHFQKKAIELTKNKIDKNKSLIGFVGGPFTLLRFAKGKKNKVVLDNNSFEIDFLSKTLIPLLKKNIQLQLNAGAEIVMIFDSGLNDITEQDFNNCYLDFIKDFNDTFKNKVGYYAKGISANLFNDLIKLNFAGIGCDSNINIKNLLINKSQGFIQGNFDEKKMLLDKLELKEELNKYCESILTLDINQRSGWVCGLGHGIQKETPEENVHLFIKTIREKFK